MKKFFLFLFLACVAVSVKAQRWTVWYGVNYSNEIKSGPLNHWHFANGGIDYSIPVNSWNFTIGAGLNTKGGLLRVNYAQLEGNAAFHLVNIPDGFQVSAFTGPCFDIRVADNRKDWVPFFPKLNPISVGWQAGILAGFKSFALKVGYERALTGYYDHATTINNAMPSSITHSLIIRFGYLL